jgi:hypothetical protein
MLATRQTIGGERTMIAYEELCQALDHFNSRLRNEAEMAALERGERAPSRRDTKPDVDEDAAAGFANEPPEDTHEIDDVDEVVVDER